MANKSIEKADTEIAHGYFQGHHCDLTADKISAYNIKCGPCMRFILYWTTVNTGDVRARSLYRSYAALHAEKYRQYKYFPYAIHPYSKLRVVIETIFIIIIMFSNIFQSIRFSTNLSDEEDHQSKVMTVLDYLYILFAISNFFSGYITGISEKYAVLNLKSICCRYLKTWFIVDILSSCQCLTFLFDYHLSIHSVKLIRLPILLIYVGNLLAVLEVGIIKKTLVETFMLVLNYLIWNVFFQFFVEYWTEGSFTPVHPRNCSWLTIANLWNATTVKRFAYAWDRSVGMLQKNSNMNLNAQGGCFATFFVISWIISKLLVVHCILKSIISLFGHESARAKYFIMIRQVENYMNQRKFPPRIKAKMLKFYAIRFQSQFFMEERMLNLVTGQLREDIIMHTGRQLVRELEFLKQLPRSLLLQIGLKLGIVIFIAGDIIFKINTVGDCLYFIHKGTVAIYSESGKEICHLEDGDFFGEIALVMKHRFRTASAVAVTNCELFRLNREDFDSTIACYPTVYQDIKRVATNRYERTSVLNDHRKTEMQMENYKTDVN